MGKYIMVVNTDANPGQDEEFNRWYDEQHIADVCGVPGVKSAKRYTADPSSMTPAPGKYLTIYELETDDPAGIIAELGRRGAQNEFPLSSALNLETAKLTIYKAH